ncbi:archaellin/type IV pilin N-terminal domain-containing protein [Methanolacinia paynteri]|uniref:archaellin/type IV pilin N-terminal domain-containing protein n=1 Tax=Methanolacinia paynteri TaxID=230356 RepID=UPI00064F8CF8|nr:archaellin/type IV pilin N-terminal domain-containing protein [Methanolacinia paynteri]
MKMFKSEEGFTGLEAAIVLIAFVVVAAVFSYVVLGAGFFTTQKAQETVYSSVDMASSSIEVLGDIYGWGDNESTAIDGVQFVVGLTAGGSSVDFAQTTLVFTNTSEIVDLERDAAITSSSSSVVNTSAKGDLVADTWYITDIQNNESGDGGALLENQEQFTIFAKLGKAVVTPNEAFTIEIKPPTGASYAINRKGPARITNVSILY